MHVKVLSRLKENKTEKVRWRWRRRKNVIVYVARIHWPTSGGASCVLVGKIAFRVLAETSECALWRRRRRSTH